MKLKIHAKLLLSIMTTATMIYIIAIGFILISYRSTSLSGAKSLTDAIASKYANIARAHLNEDMVVVRALAHSFTGYKTIPTSMRQTIYTDMLTNVFLQNTNFLAVWVNWEIGALDSTYKLPYGRRRTEVFKQNNALAIITKDLNTDGDNVESQYYKIKISTYKEWVVEPYWYNYVASSGDSILETSCAVPIYYNNKFVGLVGVDVPLQRFQNITNNIKPYEKSYAFLVANNSNFVSHPNKEYINKSLVDLFPEDNAKFHFGEKIKNGEALSYIRTNKDGSQSYITFAPLIIGKSTTPWTLGVVVPMSVIMSEANTNFLITFIVAVFGFMILGFIIFLIARSISKPLIKISTILKDLARGMIDEEMKMVVKTNDEIGEIRKSVNILIDGLKRTSRFAHQIGEGNFDAQFELLSEQDMLGSSLLEMRKSLHFAEQEDAKRKDEDNRQHWMTVGYAKFAEILRENQDDMDTFSYSVISNLVKYVNADQGGLYLINEDNPDNIYIELSGYFGYSNEKIEKKQIEIGENLVGICVKLAENIYLTDVPENYIKTGSGLGSNRPNSLLIVPLKYNNKVFGAVELASFTNVETYQIQFVERVGESIASTISNVKLNVQTVILLNESKTKSAELLAKEENLQKNIVELISTQKEATKRESEMKNILAAIESITMVAEYDMEGKLVKINDRLLEFFKVSRDKLIGKYQGSFDVEQKDGDGAEQFNRFWSVLRSGKSQQITQHVQIGGKEVFVQETYTPIFDDKGLPFKVLNIAIDVTDKYLLEKLQKQQMLR